ncbi:MAG: hypothetical protein Q4G65_01845 [bacterium]|nr:hypothetical protein [bacterium]
MMTTVLVIVGISVAAVLGMFAMGWWCDRSRTQEEGATVDRHAESAPLGKAQADKTAA